MRIGILGGTFDPVHNGHIYLAKKVCRKLKLPKVIFIPAYIPPHKKGIKATQAKHRYNMLKLAAAGDKKLKISDMEIKRKGRSYSVETLRRLRKRYGAAAELFFITGSDSLKELDKWKNLNEILQLCKFVIVERPGFKAAMLTSARGSISPKEPRALVRQALRLNSAPSKHPEQRRRAHYTLNHPERSRGTARAGSIFLKINAKDISATNIRSRIKTGRSLTGIVPQKVADYIYRNKLYI